MPVPVLRRRHVAWLASVVGDGKEPPQQLRCGQHAVHAARRVMGCGCAVWRRQGSRHMQIRLLCVYKGCAANPATRWRAQAWHPARRCARMRQWRGISLRKPGEVPGRIPAQCNRSAAALQVSEAVCTLLNGTAADRVRYHHHKSWRRSTRGTPSVSVTQNHYIDLQTSGNKLVSSTVLSRLRQQGKAHRSDFLSERGPVNGSDCKLSAAAPAHASVRAEWGTAFKGAAAAAVGKWHSVALRGGLHLKNGVAGAWTPAAAARARR